MIDKKDNYQQNSCELKTLNNKLINDNKEVIISRIAGSSVAEERLSAASEAFAPLTWKGIGSCR